MPGLVPGSLACVKDVDGRDEPGHDEFEICGVYFTPSSSTSNISVAFGGIRPPAPRAP